MVQRCRGRSGSGGTETESLKSLKRTISSILEGLIATLVSLIIVQPVAAQSNKNPDPLKDIGKAMCGTGLGQFIGLLLAALTMYLLVKAIFRFMMAFDKIGSAKAEKKIEGQDQLKGAGATLGAAFLPGVFAGLLGVMGISTVDCIAFDLGIVGMMMPIIPVF